MTFTNQRVIFETLMIFCAWIGLFTIIMFSGYPIFWILKKRIPDFDDIPDLFWIGLTVVIAVLQIWHLFFSVNWLFLFILIIYSAACCVHLFNQKQLRITNIRFSNLLAILGITIILIVLANQALKIIDPWGGIVRFDMGNYHLQAVQWIKTFPIVPGLGNINYRLAYNNSIFLFDALIDNGYWVGRSYYIASGIILCGGIIQAIFGIKNGVVRRDRLMLNDFYFGLILVPICLKISLISSLEPDVCIFVMTLVLVGQLIKLYDQSEFDKYDYRYHLFLVAIITSVGITIKLSFAGLGIGSFAFACILPGWIWRKKIKLLVSGLVLNCLTWILVLFTWILRSVVLGGYLAFPIVWTRIPVLWQIPTSIAANEYQWIKIFARTNDPNSTSQVLSNLSWFSSWIDRLPTEIMVAGALLAFGIVTLFLFSILKKKNKTNNLFIIGIGLPFFGSLIIWFINTPDIRFVDGSIWAISLLIFILGIGNLLTITKNIYGFAYLVPIVVLTLLLFFTWPGFALRFYIPGPNPTVGIHRLGLPGYHEEQTSTGVKVNIPEDASGRCWTIPLPCVPQFNDQLTQLDLWPGRPSYIINK